MQGVDQPSYQSLVASATEGCKLCELLVDAIHSHFLGDVSPLTKEPQTEAFSLRSDIAGQYIDIGSWVVGIVDGRKVPDNFGESEFQQESSFLTKSLCQLGTSHPCVCMCPYICMVHSRLVQMQLEVGLAGPNALVLGACGVLKVPCLPTGAVQVSVAPRWWWISRQGRRRCWRCRVAPS